MQVTVKGKQLDVGEALREHVRGTLEAAVGKYFDHAIDAQVVISREAHRFRADVSVHAGRGILVKSRADSDGPYLAFDAAAERIAKQLRRYKRRLQNRFRSGQPDEVLPALQYVIASGEDEGLEEEPESASPVVVAEMKTEIPTLTVGEAVMHLDLGAQPVMMFRNRAHGELNVVYRRADGNIGWIDPKGLPTSGKTS
ncbi:MAG: ribosome-associated translation inhibitor RaiA [Proteobacteria bacterium]|nr:ribosome-associated translation inhibitor RaiA [Pseudomonadota bacterium]